MKKSFLVTGAAGFIGAALVKRLIANGERVIGIDSLNDYYDKSLENSLQNDQKKLQPEQYIRMWFDSELGCLLDKYDNVYEYNSGQIKWLGKKYDLFG